MKAHDLDIVGYLRVPRAPMEPHDAVRKMDLDAVQVHSHLYVSDVIAESGNVGNKQYAQTIPENTVLQSCVVDTPDIRIEFVAQGPAFSAPEVSVHVEGELQNISVELTSEDGQRYRGAFDIRLPRSGNVVVSAFGVETSLTVVVDELGPVITRTVIGRYPNDQTALKHLDVVTITGVADNSVATVEALGLAIISSSSSIGNANSSSPGFRTFSVEAVISEESGLIDVQLVALNSLGTKGDARSAGELELDQTVPSASLSLDIAPPHTALALNASAQATLTLNNADEVLLEFLHGTSSVSNTSTARTRTLTVTESLVSFEGGIEVTTRRTRNGATAHQTFDIPISSVELMVSAEIEGATLRGDSHFISSYPRFGNVSSTRITAEQIKALPALPSTADQDFFVEASDYCFFAYPAAMGEATFIDLSTGMLGGFDGATWPTDGSTGTTSGPITLDIDGEQWYVYRTDYRTVFAPFLVSFQNPGLEVGESGVVPHVASSSSGKTHSLVVTANQPVLEPSVTLNVGRWDPESQWSSNEDRTEWRRNILLRNTDARGSNSLRVDATSSSGMTSQFDLDFVISGFEPITVTFPPLARQVEIGSRVHDITRTTARYAGTSNDLQLRTDTRDARASYSITDGESNYTPTGGTHIWLSDPDFAAANTTGTLQVVIEELP